MIKVSILYPNIPGNKFDMDYFCNKHVVLIKRLFGDACKGMSVEEGTQEFYPSPYLAIVSLQFESADSLIYSAVKCAKEIASDIPNFTDITPKIQASTIII